MYAKFDPNRPSGSEVKVRHTNERTNGRTKIFSGIDTITKSQYTRLFLTVGVNATTCDVE
jgi:hypothetical protein